MKTFAQQTDKPDPQLRWKPTDEVVSRAVAGLAVTFALQVLPHAKLKEERYA